VRDELFDLPAVPDWWGNPYGHPEITDRVPEPWVPMSRTAEGLAVWNREVSLGEMLQPVQIGNGGTQMLISPASLELETPGPVASPPELIEEKKTRIVWRTPLQADGLSGDLTLAAEFDGFMKYTLSLTADTEATIDRLRLTLPLRRELAAYYRHGYLGTVENQTDHYSYGSFPDEGLTLPFTQSLWPGTDALDTIVGGRPVRAHRRPGSVGLRASAAAGGRAGHRVILPRGGRRRGRSD